MLPENPAVLRERPDAVAKQVNFQSVRFRGQNCSLQPTIRFSAKLAA